MVPGRTWSVKSSSSKFPSTINNSTLIRISIVAHQVNRLLHQVTDHRHQLDSKLGSLLRIVVEDSTRTKQGLDSLYRRLVTLLVLRLLLVIFTNPNPDYEL